MHVKGKWNILRVLWEENLNCGFEGVSDLQTKFVVIVIIFRILRKGKSLSDFFPGGLGFCLSFPVY